MSDPYAVAAPLWMGTDVSRPVVLGEPGRLTPLPAGPAPVLSGLPVPDIAIDWFDQPPWNVRAVSARGHAHRYEGTGRQDAFSLRESGGILACAVADGVGSEPLSHLGADLVSRELTRPEVAGWVASLESQSADVGWLADALELRAARRGEDGAKLATTALSAVVGHLREGGPLEAVITWVGDSAAMLLRNGQLTTLTAGTDTGAVASNRVSALPSAQTAAVLRMPLQPDDVLFLASDGVANLVADVPEYRSQLIQLWQDAAPMPAPLLAVVDAAVRSYDDDRTLVGIRITNNEGARQ